MRHGSLFSGIGGFDLASEWMGWENVFHCEWMPFPQKILKHYWPNAISYHDITKTDFTIHRGTIDILSGGFPCQPYSMAGKRLGKEDERHLWPEMLRTIKEIQPTWVVGENVYGLTNWNGGMVFEEVCVDLENCGYEIQPIILPACAVNAPHRRDRVWFIANNYKFRQQGHGQQTGNGENSKISDRNLIICEKQGRDEIWSFNEGSSENRITTDTDHLRLNGCLGQDEIDPSKRGIDALNDPESIDERDVDNTKCIGRNETINDDGIIKETQQTKCGKFQFSRTIGSQSRWWQFPSQSPVCGGDDGISTQLDGITFSKWRQESIKGYGNAVVPQLVLEIFKVIEQMHNNSTGIFPNHSTNS